VLHVTVVEAEGLEAKDANGKLLGNKNLDRITVLTFHHQVVPEVC